MWSQLVLLGLLLVFQSVIGDWCQQTYTCEKVRTTTYPCGWLNWHVCTKNVTYTAICSRTVKCTHGGWSGWGIWKNCENQCSKTCETGYQTCTRYRYCNNPAPENGGNPCEGPGSMSGLRPCNTQPCPVPGGWSGWGSWTGCTACSKSCATGQTTCQRHRFCNNPPPQHGGASCEGSGTMSGTFPCNTQACPIDGGWGDWTDWEYTACSKECCTGFQSRNRSRDCDNPPPQFGGKPCPGEGAQTEQNLKCNTHVCPISCSDEPVGKFFPHPCMDCNATYFRCEVNRPFATKLSCPEGQFWNTDHLGCSMTCAESDSDTEDVDTSDETEPEEFSCDSKADGFYPVADDCFKYYWCAGGAKYTMPCPPGTKFDVTSGQCAHADTVTCP